MKNNENKLNKLNRIANCVSELLKSELSLKFNNTVYIPLNVFQNLVWNNNIISGSELLDEIIAAQYSNYEVQHFYPAAVLTRDYIRRLMPIINGETEKKPSYSLRFPCTVTCVYAKTDNNKLTGYLFSANREHYLAQRLEPILLKRYDTGQSLSISHSAFSKLLQSSTNNIEKFFSGNYYNHRQWNEKHELISKDKLITFTSNHLIPVFNYLNEIAETKSCDYRCVMQLHCEPRSNQKRKFELNYRIAYKNIQNNVSNQNSNDGKNNYYFNLKPNQTVAYNKMHKWTYLIHIYLINEFKTNSLYLKLNINNDNTIYFITELDAKKVWNFWFHSPSKSNSYFSEFSNAVEELKNLIVFPFKNKHFKISKILIGNEKDSTSENLYIINDLGDGKYCVGIKKSVLRIFTHINFLYPKEFSHIPPKTSYSQMRFFELLYEHLPYDSTDKKTIEITIAELVFITGYINTDDRYISVVHSDSNDFYNSLYKEIINTNNFATNLDKVFIQPAVHKLNMELKNLNIVQRYDATFQTELSTGIKIPNIRFSLVPVEENTEEKSRM